MPPSRLGRAAAFVDDHLLALVLLSVGVGFAAPSLSALTPLSTPILAVMVGSVSLTLSPERFRGLRGRAVATILLVQSAMPFVAFGVARLLGLSPPLTAGFVVLGAVTPELVTPTMTELSGGDTALSTVSLVAVGFGTVAFVPGVLRVLLGDAVSVDALVIVKQLAVAVVIPMTAAIAARWRWPRRVGRYDGVYPSVSALMVVLVIGIVAAANAPVVRSGGTLLAVVAVGALALNGGGYALGWVAGRSLAPEERIAATLSVGMRDFAVAAALVVAAGFPPAASLPAVAFGVVEMVTSAGLARFFAGRG
ncbi:bile acid:sodium symporter family protein [Halopelagius fulvigenes]|uniref:Bile acid:sodium symporter family protein n=1 Tax=Halopelagius fulvigenes TaxID=1198324 RepID=A0ABD5TZG6_9EURY